MVLSSFRQVIMRIRTVFSSNDEYIRMLRRGGLLLVVVA